MHENEENPNIPMLRRGDLINNVNRDVNDKYRVLDFIGKGGFGECYAAESLLMRNYVAIKVVSKMRLKDKQYQKIHREIKLHREAQHPNIVRMYDAFQDAENFFLVLELCRVHSLLNLINDEHAKKGYFDEFVGSRYVNQLCDAVIYLAKKNVLHRDIKPGNVFIAQNGEVKLGDFGLASRIEELFRGSVSGTPNYLAPEVIRKEGHSLASEVWSIGCLIYCMLVGKPPFESECVESTYERIRQGHYSYPPSPELSQGAKDIIRDCLEPVPCNRVPIYWIAEKPWLQSTRVTGYPLMRAKSTGNMVVKDVNGNQTQLPSRYLRPKSAMMCTNASLSDRSRRKSITASHDSGFGSESDMFRTQSLAYYNLIEKINQYIADLKSLQNRYFVLTPSTFPSVAVSKWVDYTNRRGFSCRLTDGTLTVKFNEGTCLSWPQNAEYLLYTTHPFAPPRIMDSNGPLTQAELDNLEVAKEYGDYMDRELQGLDFMTDCSPKPLDESLYVVHHHLDNKHVMVLLNNGLMQVSLLESKVKIILWKEDDQRYMGAAILARDAPPCAYRVVPKHCNEVFCSDNSRVPIGVPAHSFEYFSEVSKFVEQDLPRISNTPRTVQVTSC